MAETHYIKINPLREILKAGVIVGLDPREMTAIAIEELRREQLVIEHAMASVPTNWSTIAFLAEHPTNPYLTQWGWWDHR